MDLEQLRAMQAFIDATNALLGMTTGLIASLRNKQARDDCNAIMDFYVASLAEVIRVFPEIEEGQFPELAMKLQESFEE